jgi:hypothetical protein
MPTPFEAALIFLIAFCASSAICVWIEARTARDDDEEEEMP